MASSRAMVALPEALRLAAAASAAAPPAPFTLTSSSSSSLAPPARPNSAGAGAGSMCTACLQPAQLQPGGRTTAPCCGRPICAPCRSTRTTCPVCRATLPALDAAPALEPASLDPPAYEDATRSGPDAERTDIMHTVALTDTLVGIALRYDVDAAAIRRANRLFTSNVQERKQLVIPLARSGSTGPLPPTATELRRQRVRLIRDMQDSARITAEEATFYLEAANYVLADAQAAHRADVAWSAEQAAPRTAAATTAPNAPARATGPSPAPTLPYPNLMSFSTTALPEDPTPFPLHAPIPAYAAPEPVSAPAALEPAALEPIPAFAAPEPAALEPAALEPSAPAVSAPVLAPAVELEARPPKAKGRRAIVAS